MSHRENDLAAVVDELYRRGQEVGGFEQCVVNVGVGELRSDDCGGQRRLLGVIGEDRPLDDRRCCSPGYAHAWSRVDRTGNTVLQDNRPKAGRLVDHADLPGGVDVVHCVGVS